MKNKQIPIFFACDDNYIPFLGVAISSLKENASKQFDYRIIILNEGLNEDNKNKISKFPDFKFASYQDDLSKSRHPTVFVV